MTGQELAKKDTDASGFSSSQQPMNAVTQVESSRAAQEVQAAMIVARKFPRDEHASYKRIITSCERIKLAEAAIYAYPRGGQMIKGPSIHLAKVIARNWGNLDFGIREMSQENGESQVEAFCWDMETNVKETKVFTVKHERHTRKGVTTLKDPRDIYELVANMGSRRLRACILGVVPPDVVDAAQEKCESTMAKGGNGKPIGDRIREMIVAFGKIGVDEQMIEKKLGHAIKAIVETQLAELRMVFNSLSTGMGKRHDYFDIGGPEGGFADQLNSDLKDKKPADSKPPEVKEKKTEEPKSDLIKSKDGKIKL